MLLTIVKELHKLCNLAVSFKSQLITNQLLAVISYLTKVCTILIGLWLFILSGHVTPLRTCLPRVNWDDSRGNTRLNRTALLSLYTSRESKRVNATCQANPTTVQGWCQKYFKILGILSNQMLSFFSANYTHINVSTGTQPVKSNSTNSTETFQPHKCLLISG